jgi:hypothetical protein
VADRAVSTADALALRSSGGVKRRRIREAADVGLTTPAAAGAFIRFSSHLARGPTSSGGHFSPLRLGPAELGDAARVADNALSDSRLCVEWLETQAATAGSLARPATALADDPANYAREAAMQLKWCAKQAPAAARALHERVRNPEAKCGSWRAGAGWVSRDAAHARGLRATAPRALPLAACVRSQSPRPEPNSRSLSPRADASELGCLCRCELDFLFS